MSRPINNVKTKQPRAVVGAGLSRDFSNAGQGTSSTTPSKTEAAIAELRAGVEAAFAAADKNLLGGFEEIHAVLHPFFRREHFVGWPVLHKQACPLKAAERQWFLDEILDLTTAAWSRGVDSRVIQKIAYAPILAAEREAHARSCRRAVNLQARRAKIASEMRDAMRENGGRR